MFLLSMTRYGPVGETVDSGPLECQLECGVLLEATGPIEPGEERSLKKRGEERSQEKRGEEKRREEKRGEEMSQEKRGESKRDHKYVILKKLTWKIYFSVYPEVYSNFGISLSPQTPI